MQRRDTEFLTDLIRPMDVETLSTEGRKVVGTPYDHFCYVAFNLKVWWLGSADLTGEDSPGKAMRHMVAHMIPKDELIGTLFKYIVTKIEAPGPPAQGEWYNPNVDPHDYDPEMAYDILTYDWWTWDAGDGRWELAQNWGPDFNGVMHYAGDPMPLTRLASPEFETAPTSWEIIRTTVERMAGAGPFASAPLPFSHEPVDFNTWLDRVDFEPSRSLSWDDGGWDAFFLCYSNLGSNTRFLHSLHHSSQDVEEGSNVMHIHNPSLDAELETVMESLDHAEKIAASHAAYEILMGSTAHQYDPYTDGLVCRLPIYSRAMYAAVDEDLDGIVQMLLTGLDQSYTFRNMYWASPSGHESDIVNGIDTNAAGYMVKFCNQEPLQTPLNPLYASSAYTAMVTDYLYDSLIGTNPYTSADYAWILNATKDPDYPNTPGYYVETTGSDVPPGGMKVTYYMVDETPLWHDGHQIDAFDAEFCWEFQKEYDIAQYYETMIYFDYAEVIDVPYNRTVVAYMTSTSQFTPKVLAGMALICPEHIWGCTHERDGRATPSCVYVGQDAELYDGTPITVESGLCGCAPGPAQTAPSKTTCEHDSGCVIDHPATPQNEVYAYGPEEYAWPTPEFPWLTELVGSGEFVFYGYNPTAMVSDIVAFDATRTGAPGGDPNVHYWKSVAEIHDFLEDMFWEAGDCELSGTVDIDDQIIMDASAGLWWWMPGFDGRADINSDLFVGVRDIARLSRNFGKDREL
jgi:hypothetical protein